MGLIPPLCQQLEGWGCRSPITVAWEGWNREPACAGCSGQEPSWSSSREHCAEIWGKMGVRRKIWGERVTDQPCYSYPRQMTEVLGAAEHCQTSEHIQNPKSQPLPCLQWTTNPTLKLQQPLPMPDTAYSHAARGTGAGDTMAKPLKSNKNC